MAKGKLIKAGVKKIAGIAKKPKSVTGIGKKVKPYAKFKGKQAEIAKRKAVLRGDRAPTKAAKKPGFKTGVAAGAASAYATQKGQAPKNQKQKNQLKEWLMMLTKNKKKNKKSITIKKRRVRGSNEMEVRRTSRL